MFDSETSTRAQINKEKNDGLFNKSNDIREKDSHCVSNKIIESSSVKCNSVLSSLGQSLQETNSNSPSNSYQYHNISLQHTHDIQ